MVDARLPFIIMAALSFLGGLCGIFLPETLHQKLPENLAEAQVYGKDQVISFNISLYKSCISKIT